MATFDSVPVRARPLTVRACVPCVLSKIVGMQYVRFVKTSLRYQFGEVTEVLQFPLARAREVPGLA
jgi:hypothetical protein